jgi:hypothetical protein
MVNRFLKEVFLLCLPILAGVALYAFQYRSAFPAPRISDNLSLNEKLKFYKATGPMPLDVIAVGSSMTLNNLSSRAVIEHFGAVRYMNFGTWGQGLGNTRDMVLALQAHTGARTVLICANLMEFSQELPSLPLDTGMVVRYLWKDPEPVAYLRTHEAAYYLRNMEANVIRRNDAANYEYLGFDANGGATLEVPPELRAQARWDKQPPAPEAMVDSLYRTVEDLGTRLAARHVRLVWFHSPFREGVVTDAVRSRVERHATRLRSLLQPLGHHVLDANDHPWPDSLYSDYSHLNGTGAYRFTAECLSRLSTRQP